MGCGAPSDIPVRHRGLSPCHSTTPRMKLSMPVADPSHSVIAVVDDDPGVLRSLEDLLESAEYDVRTATSAAALLDSASLAQIDCLISDVDMPGMDGIALMRQVRAMYPLMPVIFISGYPDRLMRLARLGENKPRLFTKPFQGHQLLEAVAEALRSGER